MEHENSSGHYFCLYSCCLVSGRDLTSLSVLMYFAAIDFSVCAVSCGQWMCLLGYESS